MSVDLVIPSAGAGTRMGGLGDKALLCLSGKPMIRRTLEAFCGNPDVKRAIVVVREDNRMAIAEALSGLDLEIVYAPGGETRQDSVYSGLKEVSPRARFVAVHDAARPVVTRDLFDRLLTEARRGGAAVPGVPPKDTVKMILKGRVERTLNRGQLVLVQTPQIFDRAILLSAYESAEAEKFIGTDDASLVERIGHPVRVVWSYYENIKVTTPEDLETAERHLQRLDRIQRLAAP